MKKLEGVIDFSIGEGVICLGTIPKEEALRRMVVDVEESFNASELNLLIVSLADKKEIGIGVEGFVFRVVTNYEDSLVFKEDTDIFLEYSQKGEAATKGKAVVSIEYA